MAISTGTRSTDSRSTGTRASSRRVNPTAGLGESVDVPSNSIRARMRANPATHQVWRVGVFLAGLLFVAIGVALAVLPGPLTIPPVLIGLWIWSTEFAWAKRFFTSFKRKAQEAWAHAKAHPVSSALVTIGGLVLAGVAFWAVGHFQLVDRAMQLVGVG